MKPVILATLATIIASGASRPVRKWVFILIALAVVGAGTWYFIKRNDTGKAKPEFQTAESKTGRIALVVTAAGNLAPTNQIIVGSELSGTAKEVLVDSNDPVKKDQILAMLDTTKLDQQTERSRASLLAAKARVSQAEATVAEANASLARQEELHDLDVGCFTAVQLADVHQVIAKAGGTTSAAGGLPHAPPWRPRGPPFPAPRRIWRVPRPR